jgi:hypothetical protein
MIKVVDQEGDLRFSPALIRVNGKNLDAKFHKCPETGVIQILVEEDEEFPFDQVMTLTVSDGNNSSYTGVFSSETGEFSPV